MNRNIAGGMLIGFGVGMFTSAVVYERAAKKAKKKYMSSDEHALRTELVAWLLTAPMRGYSAEEIMKHYKEQTEFIDLIKKNK